LDFGLRLPQVDQEFFGTAFCVLLHFVLDVFGAVSESQGRQSFSVVVCAVAGGDHQASARVAA